jgi:hypothetical protein
MIDLPCQITPIIKYTSGLGLPGLMVVIKFTCSSSNVLSTPTPARCATGWALDPILHQHLWNHINNHEHLLSLDTNKSFLKSGVSNQKAPYLHYMLALPINYSNSWNINHTQVLNSSSAVALWTLDNTKPPNISSKFTTKCDGKLQAINLDEHLCILA